MPSGGHTMKWDHRCNANACLERFHRLEHASVHDRYSRLTAKLCVRFSTGNYSTPRTNQGLPTKLCLARSTVVPSCNALPSVQPPYRVYTEPGHPSNMSKLHHYDISESLRLQPSELHRQLSFGSENIRLCRIPHTLGLKNNLTTIGHRRQRLIDY